jgi:hypothetical protein
MARVMQAANPEWWRTMLISVNETCQRRHTFIIDHVDAHHKANFPGITTHENRAIGPLMTDARKHGYCVPIHEWTPSHLGRNHLRFVRVWRSLIYRGPEPKKRYRKPFDPRQFDLF